LQHEKTPHQALIKTARPFLFPLINKQNISREAAVPRSTVDVYFSILEDKNNYQK
jgi:hypothetical protein